MKIRNRDVPWDDYPTGEYLLENRFLFPDDEDDPPLGCDLWVFDQVGADLGPIAQVQGPLDIVDVGTGPNLGPLLAELLHAWSLTVVERSRNNRAYIEARRRVGLGRHDDLDAGWLGWLRHARERGVIIDPARFREIQVLDLDMFHLPADMAHVISAFSAIESATGVYREFKEGLWNSVFPAIREGGAFHGVFMENPDGEYVYAGQRFPAVFINGAGLEALFKPKFRSVWVQEVPGAREIRAGHSQWYVRALGRV